MARSGRERERKRLRERERERERKRKKEREIHLNAAANCRQFCGSNNRQKNTAIARVQRPLKNAILLSLSH
jgi:hypothetical protein